MLTASIELHSIWNQTQIDWRNFPLYTGMLAAGYTQSHHQKFSAIMAEGIPSEPGYLDQVLTPLEGFYAAKIQQLECRITAAPQEAEIATAKIRPLFQGLKNDALESLKKSYDTKDAQEILKNYKNIIRLVGIVLEDPQLKQFDPGYDIRGMNM